MGTPRLGLRSGGFVSFLVTQFLGAFNDNAFRFAIIFVIQATAVDAAAEGRWKAVAQAIFAIPFVIFAAWAGAYADRHGKSRVIVLAKVVEVLVMTAGVLAFAAESVGVLVLVLFFMSTQSTFFGPAKYGYIAENVDEGDLVRANGLVQMTTMVAIVAGGIVGGFIYDAYADELATGALLFVAIAVVGTLSALFVPRVAAAEPRTAIPTNPIPALLETWRGVRANSTLLYTVLGIGHFYLLGALLQIHLLAFGTDDLGTSAAGAGALVAAAVLGIGAGALLAGRWSEDKVELGLVPLGALTMSFGVLAMAFVDVAPVTLPSGLSAWLAAPAPESDAASGIGGLLSGALHGLRSVVAGLTVGGLWLPFALTFAVGVAGGLFIVPLFAMLQLLAPGSEKGRYLAFGNLVSFVGIGLSSLFLWIPGELGMSTREQFFIVAALSLVGTAVSLRTLPFAFVRLCGWLLAHTLYRIRVLHPERLPAEGGALLMANHVSWVDALILPATTRRGMHFLMHRPYYEWWPTHWLFKLVGCIPVAAGDSPEVRQKSLEEAGRHLDEGKIVVVFAEGAVTRLGYMLPFRRGYKHILRGRDVPIIPVHLGGLWGSIFSHAGGRLLWKVPRAFPYPVTVTYGEPLDPDAEPDEVRRAIRHLSTHAWREDERLGRPLPLTLLREQRRAWRGALHEPGRPAESPARLMARSVLLSRRLRARLDGAPRVGVLARPGLDAATAVVALQLLGRTPVLLDATLSADGLRRRLEESSTRTVVRDVAGRDDGPPLPDGTRALDLDEVLAAVSPGAVRLQLWLHALLPYALLARLVARDVGRDVDGPAVVLFSSGVTRMPRGVVLSHLNVLANVESLRQVVDLHRSDGVLGVLPFSQAFGMVTTLWFPLIAGVRVSWHPDPSDGRDVGKLTEQQKLTILAASPRLLTHFAATTRPDGFGSLRLVISGLERLEPRVRRAFALAFGIAPLEAYTSTECTAIIAMNTPNVRGPGVYQRGTRHGTVGHPLPGVAMDVVDPQTGAPLPDGESGLLRVQGPSVMRGGAGEAQPDADFEPGRLYVSGDVGRMDEHGFVTLEDRIARRALVDGVSVSHRVVEQAILDVADTGPTPVVVLSREDGEHGEALVVFYERGRLDPDTVVARLGEQHLPAPFVPRPQDFVALDSLRVTPSGTVDVAHLRVVMAHGDDDGPQRID